MARILSSVYFTGNTLFSWGIPEIEQENERRAREIRNSLEYWTRESTENQDCGCDLE